MSDDYDPQPGEMVGGDQEWPEETNQFDASDAVWQPMADSSLVFSTGDGETVVLYGGGGPVTGIPYGPHPWPTRGEFDLLVAPRLTINLRRLDRLVGEVRWRLGSAWQVLRHGEDGSLW